MKKKFDIIIIGNGSIASSIAFEIINKEKKLKIAIIGPKDREGSATSAAGLMLNVFGEIEYDSLSSIQGRRKFEMLLASRKLWANHVKSLNNQSKIKLKIKKGTVVLNNSSSDDLDDENFSSIVAGLKKYNESFEFIKNSKIKGYKPYERNRSLQSIFIPNENSISSNALMNSYDYIFENKKNVNIFNSYITKINIKKDNLKEITDNNGKKYLSENIILASGAYTQNLINQLKKIKNKIPKIFYGSGVAFLASKEKLVAPEFVVRTPNRGLACGLHVVPLGTNNLYVGATNRVSHIPINYPIISSITGLQNSFVKEFNSDHHNMRIKKIFIGHRPTSLDSFPLIGPTSIKGLWIASGTKRDGITISPLIGKAIANMVLNKKELLISKDFFPERKPLFVMTKKEGIKKAVKHIFSAAYQHQLEFPMANWKEPIEEMFYKDIENIYKKSKLKVGVPPEILNMYKYKRV